MRLLNAGSCWPPGTVLERTEARHPPGEPADELAPARNTDLFPPPSTSFLRPLLTKLNIELPGKEQTSKGSHPFLVQRKKEFKTEREIIVK